MKKVFLVRALIALIFVTAFTAFAADNVIVPPNTGKAYIRDNANDLFPLMVNYTTDGNNHITTLTGLSVGSDDIIIPPNSGKAYIRASDGKLYPAQVIYTTDGNNNVIPFAGGGGGSSAFNAITSGTNTTAAMLVGSGASLGVSGTGTITANAIVDGTIVNADLNASAAVALSKLAALTINRALVSNGSGVIGVSAVTSTELGFVSGVTSAIQTQLNAKEPTITTLAITKGGTGQATANDALNALLPSQTTSAGKFLATDGTNTSWEIPADTYLNKSMDNVDAVTTMPSGTNLQVVSTGAGGLQISSSTVSGNSDPVSIYSGNAGPGAASGNMSYYAGNGGAIGGDLNLGAGQCTDVGCTQVGRLFLNPGFQGDNYSIQEDVYLQGPGVGAAYITAPGLRYYDSSNTNYVKIKALDTLSAAYTLTLPPNDGSASQVLTTDGSGILTWTTPSGAVNIGDTIGSATEGSVLFAGPAGVLAQNNSNIFWDNTLIRLDIGNPGAVSGDNMARVRNQMTLTDPSTSAVYTNYFSDNRLHFTADNPANMLNHQDQLVLAIDPGVTVSGLAFNHYALLGRGDSGDAGNIGMTGGFLASLTHGGNAAKHTASWAAFQHSFDSIGSDGLVDDVYDVWAMAGSPAAGGITRRHGIVLEPDSNYVKDNWISGTTVLGGTSGAVQPQTLHVFGKTYGADDPGADLDALGAEFHSTANVTVDGSEQSIGIQASSFITVQSGATDDKVVTASIHTTARGDGTDEGTLEGMDGQTNLIFNNSGAAGVTNAVRLSDNVFILQQGNVGTVYDFESQVVHAGGTITGTHYGVYVHPDSTNPTQSYLPSHLTVGGTSFSAATADVALQVLGTGQFKGANIDTATRDALTAEASGLIYNTDTLQYEFYNGTVWAGMGGGGGGMTTSMNNADAVTAMPSGTNLQWVSTGGISTISTSNVTGAADSNQLEIHTGSVTDAGRSVGAIVIQPGDGGSGSGSDVIISASSGAEYTGNTAIYAPVAVGGSGLNGGDITLNTSNGDGAGRHGLVKSGYGYQLTTSGPQPTCTAALEGLLWILPGANTVFQVCSNVASVATWVTH